MVTVASCGAGALRRPVRSAPLRRAPTGLAARAAVPEGPAAAQPTRRSTRRRDWLLGIGCTLTAAPRGASAGVDVGGLLEAQRDRDYEKLAEGLAEKLRAPVEAERDGAKETVVRRKAGDAGEAIKEFLSLPQEQTDGRESAQALTTAISELGNFYRANGPRTRLTDEARRAVLGAIERGEAALEREKQARRDAKKSGR